MLLSPWQGGDGRSQSRGSHEEGDLRMKVYFQIFKSSFSFDGRCNRRDMQSRGSHKRKKPRRKFTFSFGFFFCVTQPVAGRGWTKSIPRESRRKKRVCQNRNSVVLRTRNPTNLYKSNKWKCWYTEWKILDRFVRFSYGDFQFYAKCTSSILTHPLLFLCYSARARANVIPDFLLTQKRRRCLTTYPPHTY